MDIFSARLKWLRERKGYTQKEMAEKLGITQSYYAKFEYGQRQPNLETLAKLPDLLDESIDFLLGLEVFDAKGNELFNSCRRAKLHLMRLLEESKASDNHIELDIEMEERYFNESLENYLNYIEQIPFARIIEPQIVKTPEGHFRIVALKKLEMRVRR